MNDLGIYHTTSLNRACRHLYFKASATLFYDSLFVFCFSGLECFLDESRTSLSPKQIQRRAQRNMNMEIKRIEISMKNLYSSV